MHLSKERIQEDHKSDIRNDAVLMHLERTTGVQGNGSREGMVFGCLGCVRVSRRGNHEKTNSEVRSNLSRNVSPTEQQLEHFVTNVVSRMHVFFDRNENDPVFTATEELEQSPHRIASQPLFSGLGQEPRTRRALGTASALVIYPSLDLLCNVHHTSPPHLTHVHA